MSAVPAREHLADKNPADPEAIRAMAEALQREEVALDPAEKLIREDAAREATAFVEHKRVLARAEIAHPGLCRVWTDVEGIYFQFADVGGEMMWTFPIVDEGGALFDWVAWHPGQPNRWWLLRGEAITSNPGRMIRAQFVATPAAWAVDIKNRVCVLQPKLFNYASELRRHPIAPTKRWRHGRETWRQSPSDPASA